MIYIEILGDNVKSNNGSPGTRNEWLYTVCLLVRGDNLRAAASGLSPVRAANRGFTYSYSLTGVDLARYGIFCAHVCYIWGRVVHV